MANQEQKLWPKTGESGVRPVRTFTAMSLWKLDQDSDEGGAAVVPQVDWRKDHDEGTPTRGASPPQVDTENRVNEAEGEAGENGDSDDEFDEEDEEDCLVVTMEDPEHIFDFEEPSNYKLLSTARHLAPTEGLGYQEAPVATSAPCSALSRAQIGRQLVREWLDRQDINLCTDANKSRPPLGKSRSRRSHIRTFSAGTLQALKSKLGSHTRHGRSSSSISTSSFTSIASISTAASTSSSVSSSTALSKSGPTSPHSASFHSLSWASSSNLNRGGNGSNNKLGSDSAVTGSYKNSHLLPRDLYSHAKEQEPLKRRGSTASLVTHQNSCCPGHEARETKRFSWLLRRRYKCDMAESNIGNLLFLLMWYPQLSVELLTMQFADVSLKRAMCQLLVAKLLANPSRKRPQRLTLQCILWNLLKHQFSIDRHQPLQSNSSAASFLSSVLHEPSCSQALLDRINPILDTVCGSAYDALLRRGEAAQHESAALVASRLLVVLEENRSTLFPEVVYSICAQVDLLVKHYGLERTAVVGGQLFCLRFLNRLIISHAGAGKRNVVLCKVASLLQALCGVERNSVVEPVTQLPEVANFFATGRSRMRAFVDSLCLHAPPAVTYAEMLFKMEEIEVALDLERCLFQATSEQAYTGPIILLTPADIQILVQSILLLADAHSDAYGRAMLQAYTQPRIRHLQSLVSTRRTNREECSHLDFRPAFIYFPPLCASHPSFPAAACSSDLAGPVPLPSTNQVPVIPETFVSRLRLAVIDISNQADFQSHRLVPGENNRPVPGTAPLP